MIGWLDAASGASGDMLLGALLDVGAPEAEIRAAVDAVAPEDVVLRTERVLRGTLGARRAVVEIPDSHHHRGLSTVLRLLDVAAIAPPVREHAGAVFARLAEAEARVHGIGVDDVHFHEVGALDAIADIVGTCAGFVALGLESLHCSPVAVGSGFVETAHGRLSVPPPAVVELMRGVTTYAGPAEVELCTPTGAALLRHWVTHWGPQPAMSVTRVGVGAGGRDFASHANVLRLLVGDAAGEADTGTGTVVLETNVDDLDPRLWPRVLMTLLELGASDAWLTPIIMKKGRPANTLSVLVRAEAVAAVREAIYLETSAIGMRQYPVTKHELDREVVMVEVEGCRVRVKIARSSGAVVNAQPEYDDIAAAADTLGRSAKWVLAAAVAAAQNPAIRD